MAYRRFRVGRIGYLNVLPIYYPLEHGTVNHNFYLVYGSPAELNELIKEERLDISVVSSIEYARRNDRYIILPDLSIACRGPVKSVLLFSHYSIYELDRAPVHLTPQSHTSVALVHILLKRAYGLSCQFVTGMRPLWHTYQDLGRLPKLPPSYLSIGDEALYWQKKGIFPFIYDLGKLWWEWTGLPFAFALWVCRKELIEKEYDRVLESVEIFHTAKQWGRLHIESIIEQAAQTTFLTKEELRSYFGYLCYDLDDEIMRGLKQYFSFLFEAGMIPSPVNLEIFSIPDHDGSALHNSRHLRWNDSDA